MLPAGGCGQDLSGLGWSQDPCPSAKDPKNTPVAEQVGSVLAGRQSTSHEDPWDISVSECWDQPYSAMAWIRGPLPPMGKNQMEFLSPGFSLAQPRLLQPLAEQISSFLFLLLFQVNKHLKNECVSK